MIANPWDITDWLGLKDAERSPLALANCVKAGLPLSALERLSNAIAPDDASFPYRFVPRAALVRRKSASKAKLTINESDRVVAVAQVWGVAMEIYRDKQKARAFLFRRHPMLENQRPIDLAIDTGIGAKLVIHLLGCAAYGGAA